MVNILCMLPVERCRLHCAAGYARMRAHMVACSSFQRAVVQASVRVYMVTCGSFWSLTAHSIVLQGAGGTAHIAICCYVQSYATTCCHL